MNKLELVFERFGIKDFLDGVEGFDTNAYQSVLNSLTEKEIKENIGDADFVFICLAAADPETVERVSKNLEGKGGYISLEQKISDIVYNLKCMSLFKLQEAFLGSAESVEISIETDTKEEPFKKELMNLQNKYELLMDNVDWNYLSRKSNLTPEFVMQFNKLLNMRVVVKNVKFDDWFIQKLYDEYPFLRRSLLRFQKIDDKFILRNESTIDFEYLLQINKLTNEFINTYSDQIPKVSYLKYSIQLQKEKKEKDLEIKENIKKEQELKENNKEVASAEEEEIPEPEFLDFDPEEESLEVGKDVSTFEAAINRSLGYYYFSPNPDKHKTHKCLKTCLR